jgi:S1-C subfamily serine protease
MKRFFFAVFCALALVQAHPLQAQEWRAAATDNAQAQFQIDYSSVKMDGGYVTSWTRVLEPRDLINQADRKSYHSVSMRRYDNCTNQTFAVTETIFLNSQNTVNSSVVIPQEQWQFVSIPPGSVADAIQKRVCALAAYRAALRPAIKVGPATPTTWQSISYDPASKVDFYVATDSIAPLSEGLIGFVYKTVARTVEYLPDGTSYKTAINYDVADCKNDKIALLTSDNYDSADNLTSTAATPRDQLQLTSVNPGSNADLEMRFVCSQAAAGAAAPSEARSETVSGTAWLGPKGYLVTADHVVAGAGLLILGQDGKRIGTAEIVLEDSSNDIAVLRPHFTTGGHTAIALSDSTARLGQKVFTLGFPDPSDMGVAIKMTSGEISATSGADPVTQQVDDPRLLQISVPVQPGNSGGPVMDQSGRAVGVVLSRLEKAGDHVAQNVNYALKIGYLRNLLADLPDAGSARSAVRAESIVGVVAEVQDAVFLIIAEAPRR